MTEGSTHVCRKCKREFPATTEFFYRAGRYFNWICKPCMISHAGAWKRARNGYLGPHERVCQQCGAAFVTVKRVAHFCSRDCQVAARHVVEKAARLAGKRANPRTCPRCGDILDPSRTLRAKFCSTRCAERAHAQTRKFRRRAGSVGTRPADEPLISLAYFMERDKRRCGLCGRRIDATLIHPHPLAPSLDHIVPLALGGANEPANLQVAHLRCNLSKRDRPRDEQLRLVG